MKKWILLLVNVLMLMVLLSGCMLAQPVATESNEDTFCGFWLIYDRWENDDTHVFDINSETEQMLLAIQPEQGAVNLARQAKYTSAIGDVKKHFNVHNNGNTREESIEIAGTIYLLDDDDFRHQEDMAREVWIEEDVTQSFQDWYTAMAKESGDSDTLKPGDSVRLYISQENIDAHGAELMEIAKEAGIQLTLAHESPRRLQAVAVYQRTDGSLYADANSLKHLLQADSSYSKFVETKSSDGKTIKKEKVTITITAKKIDALSLVRLVEMDAQNYPLRTTELTKAEINTLAQQEMAFHPESDAAYVIVEETYQKKAGDSYKKRTVYNPPPEGDYSAQLHTFHFPLDSGLTEAAYMNISFESK